MCPGKDSEVCKADLMTMRIQNSGVFIALHMCTLFFFWCSPCHHLIGLVVEASALGAEDPGLESRLCQDFSGSSHAND